MIGSLLAALVAASYLGLGVGAYAAPEARARNYGIPLGDDSARAYLRATGARDAVLGLLLLTFLVAKRREALGATLGISAAVGASDFAIVLAARGARAKNSLAIHGIGTLGLLGTAALIRAGG